MAQNGPFNLFAYGTLMNPAVFRAVLGRRLVVRVTPGQETDAFYARWAILPGYKKVSPDNTYLYATPDPQGRIRGYLIADLPRESMSALRQYEGKNYKRRAVQVQTDSGMKRAVAFVGDLEQMEHSFGYEFRDHFKQEILLEEKIDAALLETEQEQLNTTEKTARRAVGELRGDKIRDLRRKHFEAGGISDYIIRHSLKGAPLPDFARIIEDPEAAALAGNYLAMVIRQVIFNELEEFIHRDFRYELDHMDLSHTYYDKTVSSLAALRMLNAANVQLQECVANCLGELSFREDHLVDFVRWAIEAADAIYHFSSAKRELDFIRNHMGGGFTPLGAELEFSNIGHAVVRDPKGGAARDPTYDGFLSTLR